MKTYPESPTDLGEEWLKNASGDEGPCLKPLPQLAEIGTQVCIRNTHGSLSRNSSTRLTGKQRDIQDMLSQRQHILLNEGCPNGPSSSRPIKLIIFDKQPSQKKPAASDPNALDYLQQKKQMGRPSSPATKTDLALPPTGSYPPNGYGHQRGHEPGKSECID